MSWPEASALHTIVATNAPTTRDRRRGAVDRGEHRGDDERRRDDAQRGQRLRARRERREEARGPREPQQDRGRDARRVGPRLDRRAGGRSRGQRQRHPRDAQQPQEERTRQVDSVRGARARLERAAWAIVEYRPMSQTLRAPVLVPGVATGIGSLPHDDPVAAAELVLRCLPELPAAPQLPARDPREGMLAQWFGALPEVTIAPDGAVVVDNDSDAAPECDFADRRAHGARDVPRRRRGPREASGAGQGAGHRARSRSASRSQPAGVAGPRAFRRAAEVTRAWSVAIEELVGDALPGAGSRAVLRRARAGVVAARRRAARPRVGDRRVVGRARGRRLRHRRARVRRRRRRRSRSKPVPRCSASR